MTARGDSRYDRTFREAFIRPGLDPARWGNRSNYAALNVVPTGLAEMSIYATPFRRFVLRTDGFASVHAGADLVEMRTRPLRFVGRWVTSQHSEFGTGTGWGGGGSLRLCRTTLPVQPVINDNASNPAAIRITHLLWECPALRVQTWPQGPTRDHAGDFGLLRSAAARNVPGSKAASGAFPGGRSWARTCTRQRNNAFTWLQV